MDRDKSNSWLVIAASTLTFCVLAAVLVAPASAYLFGPGKYCGVVVFDRWGTCYLLSGPYINYVASDIKSALARYEGQAVQIDASKVGGVGDAVSDPLILSYKILGPAPEPKRITIDGLKLVGSPAFGRNTRPQFLIEIRNVGEFPVKVDRSLLGIFLFKKKQGAHTGDESGAFISRSGIEDASYISTAESGGQKISWGYIVDMQTRPRQSFVIQPGQSARTRIRFKIPSGKYQFMFAYGDGVSSERSLISNAISFDMGSDGRAINVL